MARRAPNFTTFVRRVHARHIIIRVGEGAGWGVLGGCAAGLPLVGIAMYRGFGAAVPSLSAVVLGAIAGAAHGWTTRPTPLQSAMEADQQLGWADLLGTAVTLPAPPPDPWAAAIATEADAKCASVAPNEILLRRLGSRVWGGIGLAAALLLVLGLFPSVVATTTAAGTHTASADPLADFDRSGSTEPIQKAFVRGTPREQDPDDPNASRMDQARTSSQGQPDNSTPPTGADSNQNHSSPDKNGSGSGQSHSAGAPPGPRSLSNTGTDGTAGSDAGVSSDGSGQSARSPRNGDAATAGIAGRSHLTAVAPPWQSETWPTDVQRAQQAIRSEKVPEAYGELIRAYFDPSASDPFGTQPPHDR